MELEKAIMIKDRVIAIDKIDKILKKLTMNKNSTNKIRLYENTPDASYNYLTLIQPYEIDPIIEMLISENEETKQQIIDDLKNNF